MRPQRGRRAAGLLEGGAAGAHPRGTRPSKAPGGASPRSPGDLRPPAAALRCSDEPGGGRRAAPGTFRPSASTSQERSPGLRPTSRTCCVSAPGRKEPGAAVPPPPARLVSAALRSAAGELRPPGLRGQRAFRPPGGPGTPGSAPAPPPSKAPRRPPPSLGPSARVRLCSIE